MIQQAIGARIAKTLDLRDRTRASPGPPVPLLQFSERRQRRERLTHAAPQQNLEPRGRPQGEPHQHPGRPQSR